jgi:adenylate cyclase
MSPESFKRKLTAILSADVKGYSRLMGENEAETVKTLTAYRKIMGELIQHHRGRVIDSPGDNILAEFGSVVDAVQCSVAAQNEFKARNAELPENRRMVFRIGVNLGDVIEEEGRIYGDGVNIAARLESLADPGGICISKTAFDHIESKLPLGYQFLGEQTVKNIAKPVGAYKVLMEPRVLPVEEKKKAREVSFWQRKPVLAGTALVLVVVIGVAIWNFYSRTPRIEPASEKKMAYPLPDKPSIAVLPFVNMSEDPQQEYFSDGMTEDLITDLSKISGLFVIARNSTFVYKGKPVKIRQVAEELGVRYVLEGSVRRAGDQVRINAQLIDSTTGQHLWAERYDGSMQEVFSLQDRINQKIVVALAVKLTAGEKTLVSQKGTHDPAAYEEFLRGREHYLRNTIEDYAKAEVCFKRAIELDPNYSQAKAALALFYYDVAGQGPRRLNALNMNYEQARLRARQYLKAAMKEPTSIAYVVAGILDLTLRQWDKAISQYEKALALDPNDPLCNRGLGMALIYSAKPKEGMEYLKSAMRLDPLNPARDLFGIGLAQFCMGEWQEAVTASEKAMELNPDITAPAIVVASAYAHLGLIEKAEATVQAYQERLGGDFSPYFFPFKDRRVEDSFFEGLRKAGAPSYSLRSLHVSKEDQLAGDDLRALFYPSTTTGFASTRFGGSLWSQEIAKDGAVTLRPLGLGELDTGKSWLEDDTVCFQFQKAFSGMAYCSTIFKNQRGSPATRNEYIGFNDMGWILFSRVQAQ